MKTREIDLRKLNSITKYPSIPTYHKLGERGILTEDLEVDFGESAFFSEKIDGTNARIVIMPDGTFIIGSREELLYARNDLIINQTQNIVPTILPIINNKRIVEQITQSDRMIVYYGEAYGYQIGTNYKNYATTKTGFRLFDGFMMHRSQLAHLLDRSLEEISLWRERGNQPFFKLEDLYLNAEFLDLEVVPSINAPSVPKTIEETQMAS